MTEHELDLIRKREKELEKSKNELQVLHAVYKCTGTFSVNG